MEQTIQDIVVIFNDFLWSKVLIILLVVCGIYFTTKTRFMQFRMIGDMVKVLLEPKSKEPGKISPFQAFCISMAARVGTGNITGIALAIALGDLGLYSGCGSLQLSDQPPVLWRVRWLRSIK